MLIQNKRSPYQEVTILQAVANDTTIRQHHNHIVVKISRNTQPKQEDMAHKEYRIGKSLEQFTGFLKYICLFSCFDDSINRFGNNDTNRRSVTGKICNAKDKIQENWKYVLVMPYFKDGSIKNYNWKTANVETLKYLVIHTILSISQAFLQIGFIHGDLHLDNVLLKKTKITQFEYSFAADVTVREPIMGWKPVIMDFEKSSVGVYDLYLFWNDLHQFTKNIDGIENNMNERILWKEETEIMAFIIEAKNNRLLVRNVLRLVEYIKNSTFTLQSKTPTVSYNPNLF